MQGSAADCMLAGVVCWMWTNWLRTNRHAAATLLLLQYPLLCVL
jgi:hypothetical protein